MSVSKGDIREIILDKEAFVSHIQRYPYLIFFNLFKFNWKIIALQYWFDFCHTSTWISHKCHYVPCLLNLPPTSHKMYISINFYWSLVALQCHASFCCPAKWISCTYTYITSSLDFLPICSWNIQYFLICYLFYT